MGLGHWNVEPSVPVPRETNIASLMLRSLTQACLDWKSIGSQSQDGNSTQGPELPSDDFAVATLLNSLFRQRWLRELAPLGGGLLGYACTSATP
ncbi:hypothetical protein Fuma_01339 [Fuerstiella marisgermanici]|uniref:Uncharacterized protein n=1 Tax=Fuerstiella marisgermanici TaxID=1891926 RepID=A0A1P8WCG8_9PLAN|nr:hypothetical protein Fuma_01339 [Fuerstiella marisgermanici]